MIDPTEFRGTDISYYYICKRRTWLSLHEIMVTDGTQYIKHGNFLSQKQRDYGYKEVSIGRNKIDNLKVSENGVFTVHEFKRGKNLLTADIMQVSHYMNVIEHSGNLVDHGEIHLLGSKKIKYVQLTREIKNRLNFAYKELTNMLTEHIPEAKRNYFCSHGCSFVEYCWS